MKLKLVILSLVFTTQLFPQSANSLFIGKWIFTFNDPSSPGDAAVDVWNFNQHSYDDTLYTVLNGTKSISRFANGIWYVREDTLFHLNTLISDGTGKQIHANKTGYLGTRIIKIDSSVLILDTPAGNYTFIKQK